MAPLANGVNGHRSLSNGHSGAFSTSVPESQKRFSDIPAAIDIPVSENNVDEVVELNLEELPEDPTELCTVLENENAAKHFWMIISLAYAKRNEIDNAIEIVEKGLASLGQGPMKEKLGLYSCLCWLYLWKSQNAPRVARDEQQSTEPRVKDDYLNLAMGALNDASRINPSFPPLFMARGILSLLKASLQPPSKPLAPGQIEHSERNETLQQALKSFESASRVSGGRNMLAVLGKARTLFSLGRYPAALECYQEVLMKMPHLQDPDPRIGIGCCLWQLNFHVEAKQAWQRALDLNPKSKIATILMGICYVRESSKYVSTDPAFGPLYKTAMTIYTQQAFKLDQNSALACATFANYFLLRRAWSQAETLARKAIEMTDVNAIASDGWYLLARTEHYQDPPKLANANDYYTKSDSARGGVDRGFLPAKLGTVQIQILNEDYDGAKFRLEKMIQQFKSIEAMILLGTLYAQDVFRSQASGLKEDKSKDMMKAIANLEAVRLAWKDPKKGLTPDASLLIILARLYEVDQPEKSLQCLKLVEQIALDEIPEEERPTDLEDEEAIRAKMREQLLPQLLNNIGCFQYQAEKLDLARESLQTALTACVRIENKEDEEVDADALVTTISYNLARTYEASGLLDDARNVYEGILVRHSDYTDARIRLAYMGFRENPNPEGGKAVNALYESDPTNLEVRALFGWYLNKAKKRANNIADDAEQRHYKHTLQQFDKHDRYSLTGMGNLWLASAREMRRDTEADREKRRKIYEKAVEFFDKALLLDPRNAYAAHGIAIALAEDRKDFGTALQVFNKLRDTLKDASIYVNLGHVNSELKQYSRAVENYELALARHRASDPQILACIGRTWMQRAKNEKSVSAMKTSLEYSQRALALAPDQIHFQFNIGFVQFQLAQLVYSLPENQRTLADVEQAAAGLNEAVESFETIARSKVSPFPRHDLEQRANMGRNTMSKQLERCLQQQKYYEERNREKLEDARRTREEELRKRNEEREKIESEAAEKKRKLAEERHKLVEASRELADRRAEEERAKEEAEYTEDSETGERVKRKRKKAAAREGGPKRRKKGVEEGSGEEGSGADGEKEKPRRRRKKNEGTGEDSDSEEQRAPKKKRKLARKSGREGNYKSTELVGDSDSEGLGDIGATKTNGDTADGDGAAADEDTRMGGVSAGDGEEGESAEEENVVRAGRKKISRRIADEDEDGDEGEEEEDVERGNLEAGNIGQSTGDVAGEFNGQGGGEDGGGTPAPAEGEEMVAPPFATAIEAGGLDGANDE